jgi:hypothetical protein
VRYLQDALALYRSGRPADALAAYRDLRRELGEQLEIGPSQSLRDLETAILRQDPALEVRPPAAVPAFVGRAAELARLDALLPVSDQAGPDQAGPVGSVAVVSAVSGTAGVGKTIQRARYIY